MRIGIGSKMEAFRWGVYLLAPVAISLYIMNPDNMDIFIQKHRFIVYPPEAQTPEEFERLESEFIEKREQRLQLQQIQQRKEQKQQQQQQKQ
ncbi:hypothetical protein CYY_007690 [Polysphondylium violaceum]|uniref:Mitochondrial cytochrome c oxidase assembly factor n=1 Tax=Polysphondylium violaceum TaxID=133409 RepID=A0A8J4UXJ0_9MYCE|nr:hypothetical protein CYY_007690 [Polysphondylium violaceum]